MAYDNINAPSPASVELPGPWRSELEQFLRWGAGLIVIGAAGWGFVFFVSYLAYRSGTTFEAETAAFVASGLSFVFLFLLEPASGSAASWGSGWGRSRRP